MPSMIIKNKLPMFKQGYPTVSDKYDVMGAIYVSIDPAAPTSIEPGTLLYWNSNKTVYNISKKEVTPTPLQPIAGFAMASNVQLATGFPGTEPVTRSGDVVNLLIKGYIATKIVAVTPSFPAGATVGVNGSELGTVGGTFVAATNMTFTGYYEATDAPNTYLVEICVK